MLQVSACCRAVQTYQEVRQLYDIDWSTPHSNRHSQEDATMYAWEVFLQDVCSGSFFYIIHNYYSLTYILYKPITEISNTGKNSGPFVQV